MNAALKFRTSELRLGSFTELAFGPAIAAALDKMGVHTPTAIQAEAIPVGLAGDDLIAVAQAGSGKTLAFALRILHAFKARPESRALVLVPSREVAMQIFRVFEDLTREEPLKACLVIGGVPDNKQNSQLKKKPRLVVATPGRLNDLLRDNKLLLQGVSTVVIDEADRMLDLGFLPQLLEIRATMRGVWQTMLFSATFDRKVEAVAQPLMREDIVLVQAGPVNTPMATLEQTVFFLAEGQKNKLLIEAVQAAEGPVIVFAGSQESAESVARHLQENAQAVDLIHGELSQGHRSRVVRDFRAAKFQVLVTSDLLARGLDVPGVELVVSYDLPYKAEDFLHRIGRTARAGRSGRAITFITPADRDKFRDIKAYLHGAREVTVGANAEKRR